MIAPSTHGLEAPVIENVAEQPAGEEDGADQNAPRDGVADEAVKIVLLAFLAGTDHAKPLLRLTFRS